MKFRRGAIRLTAIEHTDGSVTIATMGRSAHQLHRREKVLEIVHVPALGSSHLERKVVWVYERDGSFWCSEHWEWCSGRYERHPHE